jgi:small subunit ribosomal protein S4
MEDSKCKICRRAGVKLFLKGERCFSAKCALLRKPYVPGPKGKRRFRAVSDYGKELREKQKLRAWYNLRETQFRNYVKLALGARGKVEDAATLLIEILESRLDNVVFRLGFTTSREAARQMVSHRHILVNGRKTNIPSYKIKKGDVIKIDPVSLNKNLFKNLVSAIKKYKAPSWLSLDTEKMEAKIIGKPNLEEAAPPAEVALIFEYYSK